MTKLLYSATMSLDGFIAGPGGDMQWLAKHLAEPNPEAAALMEDIGALLVGANTNSGDDPNAGTDKEGAFGGEYTGPVVVLTHKPPERVAKVKQRTRQPGTPPTFAPRSRSPSSWRATAATSTCSAPTSRVS